MKNCEYGGTLYFTPRGAARAAVADYLYAGGGNGDAEVAEAIRGARAAVRANAKEAFALEADARETSPEILEACFDVGAGSYADAVRVWEDPSDEDAIAVWEIVTKNGLRRSTEFYWGSAGSQWARQFGLE